MTLSFTIPEILATRLRAVDPDLARQAFEALVLESFRTRRLSKDELAEMLGLGGLDEVDGFLKAHAVYEPSTLEDINRDVATIARHGM